MAATDHVKDANELFQTRSVEDIKACVSHTKMQIREQQSKLRQLVGGHYQDLINASDMITDMGKVCHNISTAKPEKESAESNRKKRKRRRGPALDFLLSSVSAAPQLIWQWMDKEQYFEAALLWLSAQAALAQAAKLVKENQYVTVTPEVLSEVQRLHRQLQGYPRTIQEECKRVVTCHSFCATLLLQDLTYAQTLTRFLSQDALSSTPKKRVVVDLEKDAQTQVQQIHHQQPQPTQDREGEGGMCVPVAMLQRLQQILHFVHSVFVEKSTPVNPQVNDEHSTILGKCYSIVSEQQNCRAAVKKSVDQKLCGELPSKQEVQRMIKEWTGAVLPKFSATLTEVLTSLKKAEHIVGLEKQLNQKLADIGEWDLSNWHTLIDQLINNRAFSLIDDSFKALHSQSKELVQSVLEIDNEEIEEHAEDKHAEQLMDAHYLPLEYKETCISDDELVSRYRLLAMGTRSSSSKPGQQQQQAVNTTDLQSSRSDDKDNQQKQYDTTLPPWVIQPKNTDGDINKKKKNIPSFYHMFNELVSVVMDDIVHLMLSGKQTDTTNKVEHTVYQKLVNVFTMVKDEIKLAKRRSLNTARVSQAMSRVISCQMTNFQRQLLMRGAEKISKDLKGGAVAAIHAELHHIYMAGHHQWINNTKDMIADNLMQHVSCTYWGPNVRLFRTYHASYWTVCTLESGTPMRLPSTVHPNILHQFFTIAQEVQKITPTHLRGSVIDELHKQLAIDVWEVYSGLALHCLADNTTSNTDHGPTADSNEGQHSGDDRICDVCEDGWLQILFEIRFLGSVLLPTPHKYIMDHYDELEDDTPEKQYADLYHNTIEGHIDPINWAACQKQFELHLSQCLNSVSLFLACNGSSLKHWFRKGKERTDDGHGATASDSKNMNSIRVVREAERLPQLPMMPLSSQTGLFGSLNFNF